MNHLLHIVLFFIAAFVASTKMLLLFVVGRKVYSFHVVCQCLNNNVANFILKRYIRYSQKTLFFLFT